MRARSTDASRARAEYHNIDVGAVDLVRPRSAAVEHVALAALRRSGLDEQLAASGCNGPQQAAAIGTRIGPMVVPGSEFATHQWLQQRSASGELIDSDFSSLDGMALYPISDRLLTHKSELESLLYARERDLLELDELVTL